MSTPTPQRCNDCGSAHATHVTLGARSDIRVMCDACYRQHTRISRDTEHLRKRGAA